MTSPQSHVFDNIPWGTNTVLADTLECAETSGLSVGLLPELHDIDRVEDLRKWREADPIRNRHEFPLLSRP